jgi:hypothetical protein
MGEIRDTNNLQWLHDLLPIGAFATWLLMLFHSSYKQKFWILALHEINNSNTQCDPPLLMKVEGQATCSSIDYTNLISDRNYGVKKYEHLKKGLVWSKTDKEHFFFFVCPCHFNELASKSH